MTPTIPDRHAGRRTYTVRIIATSTTWSCQAESAPEALQKLAQAALNAGRTLPPRPALTIHPSEGGRWYDDLGDFPLSEPPCISEAIASSQTPPPPSKPASATAGGSSSARRSPQP